MDKDTERLPLAKAEQIGKQLLAGYAHCQASSVPNLREACAGKETIGDIDILIAADTKEEKRSWTNLFRSRDQRSWPRQHQSQVLYGEKQNTGGCRAGLSLANSGLFLLYLTGSKEHNIKLRIIARDRGTRSMSMACTRSPGNRAAGDTEESMYDFLGVSYIPPEQRLGKDEIEEHLIR